MTGRLKQEFEREIGRIESSIGDTESDIQEGRIKGEKEIKTARKRILEWRKDIENYNELISEK
jgi:peptidoglycan hydrolase CwlO-like protein